MGGALLDGLRNALEVICRLANEYLENLDRRGDAWVALTSMVDHDGAINQAARDKIVMGVYNITRENLISTYQSAQGGTDGYAVVSPPLYLDVHLIFMANFTAANYPTGLACLSRLISFFQANGWFTQDNAPGLDAGFGKLSMEFESLSPVDVNYVMGMLGTRYLPSAFYKLRMIPFVSNVMQARTYPVRGGAPPGTGAQAAS
jgi:hypothetical protein